MKRDWDCIKAILKTLAESEDNAPKLACGQLLPTWDEDTVMFHFRLLEEAGLIEGHPPGRPFMATRITWRGYDLLDIQSNDGFWARIKHTAQAKGVAITLDSIGWLAKHVASQVLG